MRRALVIVATVATVLVALVFTRRQGATTASSPTDLWPPVPRNPAGSARTAGSLELG
ncbi:MAG: hypothetical protein M0040_06635 [Actinomycetota bacterium]|nr:hypothetical protein [Actinomycetota bacterium]